MPTPHNMAKVGEIAENCIIVGDPLRAKFIVENFIPDAKLVNTVRNMYCYTGTYNGKPISVMGHGMGMASISIYVHELYAFYGVKNIIRAGSCGAINPKLKLFDVIVAQNAYTNSNIGEQLGVGEMRVLPASSNLLEKSKQFAKNDEYFGDVLSSDVFYTPNNDETDKYAKLGCLAVEMEAFALYAEAKIHGTSALTILTVSDIVGVKEETTSEQRRTGFAKMAELALKILTE